MHTKHILIGLFALINSRTIGTPQTLQGESERAFVNVCFLQPAMAGCLGCFAQLVTADTGVNEVIHVTCKFIQETLSHHLHGFFDLFDVFFQL